MLPACTSWISCELYIALMKSSFQPSFAQIFIVYHISLLYFTSMCCIQGIPGDEGPCGEPGMTGDPVSEKKK